MAYQVKKRITGFSTCFRQWKADSHCQYLHGYALQFVLTFECETLEERNWVIDFGGFVSLKNSMREQFDHTTIIAIDDPLFGTFKMMEKKGMIKLRIIQNVGCEMFAEFVYKIAKNVFLDALRVKLISVECIENENNSAIFKP